MSKWFMCFWSCVLLWSFSSHADVSPEDLSYLKSNAVRATSLSGDAEAILESLNRKEQTVSAPVPDSIDLSLCNGQNGKRCPGQPIPEVANVKPSPRVTKPTKARNSLNRYYYLRTCDMRPETLAKFLYGDTSKASDLLAWNGGKSNWQPGQVIYYKDSKNPSGSFRSFYEAHPVIKKTYTVKPGDTLASIAFDQYGDYRSWKELAVYNDISNPDSLEKGQVLNLTYKE